MREGALDASYRWESWNKGSEDWKQEPKEGQHREYLDKKIIWETWKGRKRQESGRLPACGNSNGCIVRSDAFPTFILSKQSAQESIHSSPKLVNWGMSAARDLDWCRSMNPESFWNWLSIEKRAAREIPRLWLAKLCIWDDLSVWSRRHSHTSWVLHRGRGKICEKVWPQESLLIHTSTETNFSIVE